VDSQKTAFERDFLRDMLLAQAAHVMETAIRAEVEGFLHSHDQRLPNSSLTRIVHNGYLPERRLATPLGLLTLNVPRLRDRGEGEKIRFASRFVPRYGRRLSALSPSLVWSYLKGLMDGDFRAALRAFLGRFSPPLDRGIGRRLKKFWLEDYEDFRGSAINQAEFQFFWAQAAQTPNLNQGQALLALAGVDARGRKRFLGLAEGAPAEGPAWADLFRLLKDRGLAASPWPVFGSPELGVWDGLILSHGDRGADYFNFGLRDRLAEALGGLPRDSQTEAEPILRELGRSGDFPSIMAALTRLAGRLGNHFPKVVSGLTAR
jgi:transposase-like protein